MESRISSVEGIRVLSLEDNVIDNEILSNILTEMGVVLDIVSKARDAYNMIENNSYDLLMIDHMMPGTDGITVLKTIRERHLCDKTPAIVVTGNNISSAKNNYIESGFSEYIAKPIEKEKLLEAMMRCLNSASTDDKENIEKNSILIVDDNQMNLMLARKILSDKYNVSVVSSARAALRFLEESIPDMILLDLHMPELDGFQFLEIVKADERYKDIPIICLTADDDH